MKRSTFLILLILLATHIVSAQSTQTIRGKVIDEIDNTPLVGVNVIMVGINDSLLGSTTDVDGNYRIENVPVGRLKLSYRKEYVRSTLEVSLIFKIFSIQTTFFRRTTIQGQMQS